MGRKSAPCHWQNALLVVSVISVLVPSLFSLHVNAQQTPLHGKEAMSPSQPFSSAKQQVIAVDESVEFEVEDDVSQSVVAYTQFDTTNHFIDHENPSQILTQLSNVWSESGDENELIVGGGEGGNQGDGRQWQAMVLLSMAVFSAVVFIGTMPCLLNICRVKNTQSYGEMQASAAIASKMQAMTS